MLFNVEKRVISLNWMWARSLPDMMTDITSKGVSHEITYIHTHTHTHACISAAASLMFAKLWYHVLKRPHLSCLACEPVNLQ